jgi:S-disulfanyl-L-cysteine oxidoreductase SoxD
MSKFLEHPLIPSLTGAAAVLGTAYFLADQFVTDIPAPARGVMTPSAAEAQAAAPTPSPPLAAPAPDASPDVVLPASFALGREAHPEEIAAWDIDVRPDGLGLPAGSGSVLDGEDLYIDNCASCHGDFGEGSGRWPVLAGGRGTLTSEDPNKTIGSYWPYLSTVWDYVHRAMPFGYAQSLSADETYAITAYILYLNDIVDDDFVLTRENFLEVPMPNEANFQDDDRLETEFPLFVRDPCMTDCKETVEITARAMVLDVTPETAAARHVHTEEPAAEAGSEAAVEVAAVAEQAVEEPAVEVAAVAVSGAPDPALIAAGEAAFRQCSACHKVGEGARNGTGPHLNDIFGQPAGQVEGFRYSPALMAKAGEGLVWDEQALHDLLAKPRDFIPGTRMSFNGFRNEGDIAAVIAYLRTFSD